MNIIRSYLFWAILLTYLITGGLYAVFTPDWQSPDEPAHYNYIRYLTSKHGFPELTGGCYNQNYLNELTTKKFPPKLPINNICYEFHQPPLYYLLGTPVFVLSNGSLLALRLLSVLLGGGIVILSFFIAHTIFPNRAEIVYGTMAFVAFVPMHVSILSSVNNDALAGLILAGLLFLLTHRLFTALQNSIQLGALLGIGLITKMTVYIAIPLVAVVIYAESRQHTQAKKFWVELLKQAAIIYGLALAIALPWYVRNINLYGGFDFLGLARHNSIVIGQLRTADYLAELGWFTYISKLVTITFHSFWGQFGWMAVPMDGRVYLVLTLLSLTSLGGLIMFWRSDFNFCIFDLRETSSKSILSAEQRQAMSLMLLTVILTVLAYSWYNLTFVQFQGRYIFPAIIPLGIFFSLGLNEALSRQWVWWLAGCLTLALILVVTVSIFKNDINKWTVLIVGLAAGLATGRALLARYWFMPTAWLFNVCYAGLSLLALLSPFWFILPQLSR